MAIFCGNFTPYVKSKKKPFHNFNMSTNAKSQLVNGAQSTFEIRSSKVI